MRYVIGLLFALVSALQGQILQNADFEQGAAGAAIVGWRTTTGTGEWKTDDCTEGKSCVEVAPPAAGGPNASGILLQSIDATPFRGKFIRLRGAVRVTPGGRSALWLRVDRPAGQPGFFENMSNRPIVATEWRRYQIDGFVHADAVKVYVGVLVLSGKAVVDDIAFDAVGDVPEMREEPARPLTDTGLANLTALTRLYGIVRHFHASDEAGGTDWNQLAVDAVRAVEGAGNPEALAAALDRVFKPIAPAVSIYAGPEPALLMTGGPQLVRWHNNGFDNGSQSGAYRRVRVVVPGTSRPEKDLYRVELGRGLKAVVPLAVFADSEGRTLPRSVAPPSSVVPSSYYSGNDRGTRIADVMIAWDVFRHFYPYFDVVQTDWDGVLPWALQEAALAQDGVAFKSTLQKMVAELKDGHGRVFYRGGPRQGQVSATAAWISDKYVVTSSTTELKPGDEIVAINGKPALEVLTEAEKLISSATPQWKRSRSTAEALMGPLGQMCTLTVQSFGSPESREVKLPYGPTSAPLAVDTRPTELSVEVAPGIWYFDLTRGQDKDFDAVLPKLAVAKGIVFDMRGYPRVGTSWFSYVTKTPLRSAQWHVPSVDRPGEMTFQRGGEWTLLPKEPYLGAPKVFLTNGSAISYAESTMGIVENYRLGEIVGETTAGTNGNVNPIELPGGYSMSWTGMKVLKHDGTQHHGVGIRPTVPVVPTQEGVAAGRDELLERALELLKQ
ncbi:MAG: family peptidase [Bryobacterales bacterium]|nr:family peptidase [Bryobacterales bacterium]